MTAERARGRLSRAVPTASPTERADEVRARAAAGSFETLERVWIVDDGRLVGVVGVQALLGAEPGATMAELQGLAPPAVPPDLDQERVALHALRWRLDAVPVLNGDRFVGVVPARTLLRVLHREHVEDLHRLAGITREQHEVDRAFEEPPGRYARHRLPWLVVGLAGSLLASLMMGRYEATLRGEIAAAYFVPGIVYLADAVGTQTETLVIRGLSRAHVPLGRVVLRELGTGVWLGVVLGGLAAPLVALGWGSVPLAAAVGVSIAIACSVATSVGMALPWALSALGVDPAFGSGPLATIVQDVLSIVVYLTVVRALL